MGKIPILETILQFDHATNDWFFSLHSDGLTTFFKFITLFGNWEIVLLLALLVSVVLYRRNIRALVIPLWVALISAEGTTFVLKMIVARERPINGIVTENDFSFPSGHATVAVALYGFLIYATMRHLKTGWLKMSIASFGVIIIFAVGISRLYLGVHYPSDIFAGYFIGCAGILFGIYVQHWLYHHKKA